MKIRINGEIDKEQVEYLIERIFDYAESCASEYQNKKNDGQPTVFEQGLAQAYTEVLDVVRNWGVEIGVEISPDLEKYATEHLA